jgi:hypothetical protein
LMINPSRRPHAYGSALPFTHTRTEEMKSKVLIVRLPLRYKPPAAPQV